MGKSNTIPCPEPVRKCGRSRRKPKPFQRSNQSISMPKKTLSCPYCDKTFMGARAAQARGGHIRYKHPSELGQNGRVPEVARKSNKPAPVSIESRSKTDNYIEQTLEKIDQRRDSIGRELERFEV